MQLIPLANAITVTKIIRGIADFNWNKTREVKIRSQNITTNSIFRNKKEIPFHNHLQRNIKNRPQISFKKRVKIRLKKEKINHQKNIKK